MPNVICEYCNNETYKEPYNIKMTKHNFCSRTCFSKFKYQKSLAKQIIINNEDYLTVIVPNNKYGDVEIKIDVEYLELVKNNKLMVAFDKTVNDFYVNIILKDTRKKVRLHRFITNCPSHLVVDHLNRDPKDNRMCNLKVCTQSENMQNLSLQKNNKTGVAGVFYLKVNNSYLAYTGTKYLGSFKTLEEATKARKDAHKRSY